MNPRTAAVMRTTPSPSDRPVVARRRASPGAPELVSFNVTSPP